MWSRRHFLETLSDVPLVGGFIGASALPVEAAAAGKSRDYFRELGVRPFINASGTYTAMTASLMPPEVIEAINYASKHFVMLDELHDKVGERIATLVQARSGDGHLGSRLGTHARNGGGAHRNGSAEDGRSSGPDRHEERSDHAEVASLRLRPCRSQLRRADGGSRDAEDLERAVNAKTAMMLFYNNNNKEGRIQDEEFVQLGKKHRVPTFNDAAADVPPVENLWKYTKMGFDLVAFSGGKGIRGPQSAGLLLGKKDLIAAARLNAPPNGNTVGRGMKVNKEEIVGMLAALELYLAKDHAREQADFEKRAETIRSSAAAVPGVKAEVFVPEVANHVPHVRISWDGGAPKRTRPSLPPCGMVSLRSPSLGGPALVIGVWMMRPGEDKVVAKRLARCWRTKADVGWERHRAVAAFTGDE